MKVAWISRRIHRIAPLFLPRNYMINPCLSHGHLNYRLEMTLMPSTRLIISLFSFPFFFLYYERNGQTLVIIVL